jgi:broad specificity phosphatase PhoE
MKRLYFTRHGLSEMNKAGLWSGGGIDTPLAPEGKKAAKKAAEDAKGLNIDYIISSPYIRAYETAKIIAKEIDYPIEKIERNSLFIERNFGELEGTPWRIDINIDGFADVETVDSLMERAKLALRHIEAIPDAHNILVVSHGSFGRALRSQINGILFKKQTKLGNTEIVRFI